jgi:hypothetical protein
MVRVPTADGATRRRYSVMSVDEEAATLELWVATSHEGTGISLGQRRKDW